MFYKLWGLKIRLGAKALHSPVKTDLVAVRKQTDKTLRVLTPLHSMSGHGESL